MAFGFWRTDRKNQYLTRSQYVWVYGVVNFGAGIFLFMTVADYLGWKLLGEPSSRLSPWHLIWNLAFAISVGVSFGVITREVSDSKKLT